MKPDSTPLNGATVDAQNPWLGLTSFTEETRSFFHGREEEGAELARRVQRKLLTVLFGQSGLGKTSILQAGLVPRLRPDGFCPVYVRLDYHPDAPPPADQIKRAVFRATEAAGSWTQTGSAVTGETLWEFLHHRDDVLKDATGRTLIPILIFDQFEEIFTLAQSDDAGRRRAREFLADLADLVENRPPASLEARIDRDEADAARFDFARADYRILISLREDYLANLEALKSDMPSVTQNRMRLARMTGVQAIAAVRGPAPTLVTEAVAAAIVRFVSGGADLAHAEVEPSLLSLICRELNNTRLARGQAEISADLLAGTRDTILSEFYERAVGDQPEGVRRFIEEELLTESGYRENIALERAQKSLSAAGANPTALDTLVNRRLLRVEERLDIRRIELMHDVLCSVVKASRDVRHEREAKAAVERQLAATRAQEEVTRRSLVRARMVAAVCAVLMVAAAASAVFGYINLRRARAADAQAQASQRLAERARTESEKLIAFLLEDFYEELKPTGRGEIVGKLADKAVAYYDGLPAELMTPQTKIFRGMALMRKASALNDAGQGAEAKAVGRQAQKIFEDLRAAGDHSDEVSTALALAYFSQITLGSIGKTRVDLETATGLLRPIVASGRATRSTKLALADMLQHLAHASKPEEGIVDCEESRKLLAELGALDQSDLTAASIYGDVTDTESRMYLKLGQPAEAERLAAVVSDISEKVLEQRPGDLRAMKNRYFSANAIGFAAADRHDLAKTEVSYAKATEAAANYIRFNPADTSAWYNYTTALMNQGENALRQGRIAAGTAKLREAVALEHDPRNKSGVNYFIFNSWQTLATIEAQRGNFSAARAAVEESRRTIKLFEKQSGFDQEVMDLGTSEDELMADAELLAASGDYATLHTRALALQERLAQIKRVNEGNKQFREDLLREAQFYQVESALRIGRVEEAVSTARRVLAQPQIGSLGRIGTELYTAKAQARLGQALLAAGQRAEALTALSTADAYFRTQMNQGAASTDFRLDFGRILYQLARAQPTDAAGRARRAELLAEASAVLGGLTFEAKQLITAKELMQSVADAQREPVSAGI